jgi:glycerophosphoryl diester phosphodiesterase
MIMAHRGYSAKAPENTLPAFKMCMDEGFSAAELDVQMLGDGTIIVMHDDNLKRTTGLNKNVWEVTYDEIKDLDNGAFFDKAFEGTRIPTLDEVLKLAGSGDTKL